MLLDDYVVAVVVLITPGLSYTVFESGIVYLDVTMLATGDDTLVLSPLADKAKYVDTSSAFLEFVPASVEFKVSDVFSVSLEEEDI